MKEICRIATKDKNMVHSVVERNDYKDGSAFKTACDRSLLSDAGYHETDQDVLCKDCLRVISRSKMEVPDAGIVLAIDYNGAIFAADDFDQLKATLISSYGEDKIATLLEKYQSDQREVFEMRFFRARPIQVKAQVQTVKFLKGLEEASG